jgi:predicted Zn-dependent protease
VHEPYLPFTCRPQIIIHALAEGRCLGDAAALATPAYSWQNVLIGDPLYRPFALSRSEQWERRGAFDDDQFAYVVIREINRIKREGPVEQAMQTAEEALRERPSLLLAWKVAQLYREAGNAPAAQRILEPYLGFEDIRPDWVPLIADIAQFLSERGESAKMLAIYQRLLTANTVSPEQKLALLAPASKAAESAGAADVANVFRKIAETLGKK